MLQRNRRENSTHGRGAKNIRKQNSGTGIGTEQIRGSRNQQW